MQVALISRDKALDRLCREAIGGLPGGERNPVVATAADASQAADVCIWDWGGQIDGERAAKSLGSLRDDRDARPDCLIETARRLAVPLTAVHGYCGFEPSEHIGPLTSPQREVLGCTLHSVGDIHACCLRALDEIRPLTDEKSISVELDLEPSGQPLCFDAAQIEQLLVNPLEDSCNFTPRGGYIRLRGFPAFWERRATSRWPKGVLIERRGSISQRANAYRIEVSHDRMGLAICKRIPSGHGGHGFAESGSHGVTFVFLLPLAAPETDARLGIHAVAETVESGRI
jgi:hypothetical protein